MRTRNLSEQSFKQIMGSDYGYLEVREELVPPQVETQEIFIEGLTCSCKYSTHTHQFASSMINHTSPCIRNWRRPCGDMGREYLFCLTFLPYSVSVYLMKMVPFEDPHKTRHSSYNVSYLELGVFHYPCWYISHLEFSVESSPAVSTPAANAPVIFNEESTTAQALREGFFMCTHCSEAFLTAYIPSLPTASPGSGGGFNVAA